MTIRKNILLKIIIWFSIDELCIIIIYLMQCSVCEEIVEILFPPHILLKSYHYGDYIS